MSAFDQAFRYVIGAEGGFTDDPRDPGNWTGGRVDVGECKGTNWGIAASTFPSLDIKALTQDQAETIYRERYWTPIDADRLPPPLALLIFDAAVNNGLHRAVHWLQQTLGVPSDGQMGEHTRAALAARTGDGAALLTDYLAIRIDYMARLPGWAVFGSGWARRLSALPYHAMQMEN